MMWKNDPLKYEKYLVFDSIIAFSKHVEGNDFSEISIKTLCDFINTFFDPTKKLNQKGKNMENQEKHQGSDAMSKFFERLFDLKDFIKQKSEESKDKTLTEIYEKLDGILKEDPSL